MAIQWEDKFSVGASEIDAQHKKLFALVNNLESLYKLHKGDLVSHIKEVLAIIDELGDYSVTHFYSEEMAMEECGCPDIEEHKMKHELFVEEISTIRDNLAGDPEFKKDENKLNDLLGQLYAFLTKWLTNHILVVDMKYKDKIREL